MTSNPPMLRRRLRAEHLIRGGDPSGRSMLVTRELVRLVAEMPQDAAVAIDLVSRAGGVVFDVELIGGAVGSRDDVIEILRLCAPLEATRTRSMRPRIASAVELVRMELAPAFAPEEPAIWTESTYRVGRQRDAGFATLLPASDDWGSELIESMHGRAGLVVRTVLAPISPMERGILADELVADDAAIAGSGVMVRARTVAVTAAGSVPTLVRTRLRQRARGAELVSLAAADAAALWTDPARALAGSGMVEQGAVALARIPTSGSRGLRGMGTVRPPVRRRPLDPVPPVPERPVRIGTAETTTGSIVDVSLSAADLCRHAIVIGRSGSGKTSFINALAWAIQRAGASFTLIDPHGDAASTVAALGLDSPGPSARYIRHGDLEHPIGLDVLGPMDAPGAPAGARATQELTAFLELLQDQFDPKQTGVLGPRFKRVFMLVAQAVRLVWGERASLTIVVAILSDTRRVIGLSARVREHDPRLAMALRTELASSGSTETAELVSWVISKFQPFVGTLPAQAIFGSGIDAVDVLEIIDEGRNLIIDLAAPQIGVELARVVGAVWIMKHFTAMGRRADRRRPHIIIVDEAHLFTFGTLRAMLAEARKFGVGIILATQSIDRLDPRLAADVESNCDTVITLRTGIAGVGAASARLDGWPADELLRLPDLTAAASLSRDGAPTEPFTLAIDFYEQLAAAGWDDDLLDWASRTRAAETVRALWMPHRDALAPTDAEIVSVLEPRTSVRVPRPGAGTRQQPGSSRPSSGDQLDPSAGVTDDTAPVTVARDTDDVPIFDTTFIE